VKTTGKTSSPTCAKRKKPGDHQNEILFTNINHQLIARTVLLPITVKSLLTKKITEAFETAFNFEHHYHSWERGLNENTNGLIRQYFQKNTDIKTVEDEDVYNVMQKLNNRRRNSLGFKTSRQMMKKSFARSWISCVALQS
jgi:hypothetical protein